MLPPYIQFETNTICTNGCHFCPHNKMIKRAPASDELIDKVITELVPTAREVCPFLMQEPLMEPRLREILQKIKQYNWKATTSIYTTLNAVLNAEDRYKALFDIIQDHTLDHVYLSIYERGQTFNKEESERKLRELILYRDANCFKTPTFTWQYINDLQPHRRNETTELCDAIRVVPFDTFHGDIQIEGRTKGPNRVRTECGRLWSTFNVHSNGTVVPCCIDYNEIAEVGNILYERAEKIWNGSRLNMLRKMHIAERWNEIELCKNCNVWEWM